MRRVPEQPRGLTLAKPPPDRIVVRPYGVSGIETPKGSLLACKRSRRPQRTRRPPHRTLLGFVFPGAPRQNGAPRSVKTTMKPNEIVVKLPADYGRKTSRPSLVNSGRSTLRLKEGLEVHGMIDQGRSHSKSKSRGRKKDNGQGRFLRNAEIVPRLRSALRASGPIALSPCATSGSAIRGRDVLLRSSWTNRICWRPRGTWS